MGFDLVPRSPLNSVQIPAKANRGRSSFNANHTTSFLPVSGLGSGAYSAKLLAGTRQRLSGFSQPRQCGDVVLAFGTSVAHDGSRIVGKDARHARKIAGAVACGSKQSADRVLASRDAVEGSHAEGLSPLEQLK